MRQVLFNMLAKYVCWNGTLVKHVGPGKYIIDFIKLLPIFNKIEGVEYGNYREIEKLQNEVLYWNDKGVNPAYVYARLMKPGIMIGTGIAFLEDLHNLAYECTIEDDMMQTTKRKLMSDFAKKYRLSDNYLKWY